MRWASSRDLASAAAGYLHTFQWSVLPFLLYLVLRNFISALERPLSAVWVGGLAVVLNAFLVWVLMFGRLGFPPLGLPGAGIATTLTTLFMFVRPRLPHFDRSAVSPLPSVREPVALRLAALPPRLEDRPADRDGPRLRGDVSSTPRPS